MEPTQSTQTPSEKAMQAKAFAPYEEIQEKKTTTLGNILLIIMVIVGLWQGQGFIRSLAQNIPYPTSISYCGEYVKRILDNNKKAYSGYDYAYYASTMYPSNNDLYSCSYSDIERKNNLEAVIALIVPLEIQVSELESKKRDLTNEIYKLESTISNQKETYSLSLQEKIAQEQNTVYDKSVTQSGLALTEEKLTEAQAKKTEIQSQIDALTQSIESIVVKNDAIITTIYAQYERAVRLAEFKRALLLLILIGPALYFTTRKYFSQKRENSQYTIIWAAVAAIFALLFAQVFFSFIYEVIPHELLAKLILFFSKFAFLVTILQYVLLFIVPVLFGGIVYWIQKKVYNKEAVMIRSLKNHKCPSCEMSLRESDRFCSVCQYQIKEKCTSCNGDRVVGLAYCSSCGMKREALPLP